MVWQPWLAGNAPRTDPQYQFGGVNAPMGNDYYANIAQNALADPNRGGVLRASIAGGTAGQPGGYDPNAWNSTYQNMANQAGFTGNVAGGIVAQAPTTDIYGGMGLGAPGASGAGAGGLPPMNPGETSMQYMLRIGMSPTAAQAALSMSQQNPGMSFQQIMASSAGAGAGAGPLANRGGSSTAAGALATAGNVIPGNLPPMNAGESSAAYMARIGMSQSQIQAALTMAQQNPGMSFQDIIARMNAGGATGAGTGPLASTQPVTPGGLPPINPGEDSTAYMTRIGMSPADIQAALAMSKANPGMSFQQIIAQLHGGAGGGTATTSTGMGSPNYPIDVNPYLDPSMKFQMDEGMRALESSASAAGQTLSGNTLRDILKFSQGLAGTDWANAYNRAAGQQAFTYGVDTGDRNFARQTQLDDFNRQLQLSQLGLSASGQQSNLLAQLAGLISGNINAAGSAGASGTLGLNAAQTTMLNQILAALNTNVNRPGG